MWRCSCWATGVRQHQVLRAIGSEGSRNYSALETHDNQCWPARCSILAWRTPDREAWRATVHRTMKSWAQPKRLGKHGCKASFACGCAAQRGLSLRVAQLLGSRGPWRGQVRGTGSVSTAGVGPFQAFGPASCSCAQRPACPSFW